MVERLPTCKKLAMACQQNTTLCVAADDYCNLAETTPYYNTGLNPYDIRVPCGESDLCYDFTNVETFMNLGFSCDLHMKFVFFFLIFFLFTYEISTETRVDPRSSPCER